MPQKYSNPPIVEAVCEVRFTPETSWDLTIPGLMYERLRKDFPIKEQMAYQEFEIGPNQLMDISKSIKQGQRMVFRDTRRNRMIQLGDKVLSMHVNKPYKSWTEYRESIHRAYSTIMELVPDPTISRIGLRYINQIHIPGKTIELENYFNFRPFIGGGLPQNIINFIMGCVYPFENERDQCRVQLVSGVSDEPTSSLEILDLDYYLVTPNGVDANQVLSWIDDAHREIESIFEASITDATRELFKA